MEPAKGTHTEASLQGKGQGGEPTGGTKTDTTLSVLAHLAPIAGAIIPFGGFLLLLGVFLLGRRRSFVRAHAKESLNAQISYLAYGLPLSFLLLASTTRFWEGTPLGKLLFTLSVLLGVLLSALVLWNMVAAIRAALRKEGYAYRLVFRLIR